MGINIEISPGELIDKITILEIKAEHIHDENLLSLIHAHLNLMTDTLDKNVQMSPKLTTLIADLKKINEKLWDVENQIRVYEREKNFGIRFIELARSLYKTNDERSNIKRDIDLLLLSKITEVKVYEVY